MEREREGRRERERQGETEGEREAEVGEVHKKGIYQRNAYNVKKTDIWETFFFFFWFTTLSMSIPNYFICI